MCAQSRRPLASAPMMWLALWIPQWQHPLPRAQGTQAGTTHPTHDASKANSVDARLTMVDARPVGTRVPSPRGRGPAVARSNARCDSHRRPDDRKRERRFDYI